MKIKRIGFGILTCFVFLVGCATPKTLVPTGGSRADGIVKMSYQYGAFEAPQVSLAQGVQAAKQRCSAWGYSGAEPFGGQTRMCVSASGGSCNVYQVTIEYQCTGTPPASR